jgi:phospholipase C
LVISPWARRNFVDHSITDQSSVLRFVEDNWLNGERIQGSFDAVAGPINGMFNFEDGPRAHRLFLDAATGQIVNDDDDREK